jgi:hypothetical protein
VDSGPLPVAPLHLGSPWGGAAEFFRASSLGFDLVRCRHDPPGTGHRAHRLGLACRTNRTRRPAPTWSTTPTPLVTGPLAAEALQTRVDSP